MLPLLVAVARSRFGIPGVIVMVLLYVVWTFVLAPARQPGDTAGTRPLHQGGAVGNQSAVSEQRKHFVAYVLDDTQSTWARIFAERHKPYRHAKLVLFSGSTDTACGYGRTAQGPFYCPGDEHVYLDLTFFDELSSQLGAKGKFADAYVVAHELGHHVQKLTGVSDRVRGDTERGANGNSVRMELQADCYAGVWANATKDRSMVDQADVESALTAAQAIGDDKLQREARGVVRPDTFTHGTSAQRVRWWRRGLATGNMDDCDTFSANPL
jgi:hypothetical protein